MFQYTQPGWVLVAAYRQQDSGATKWARKRSTGATSSRRVRRRTMWSDINRAGWRHFTFSSAHLVYQGAEQIRGVHGRSVGWFPADEVYLVVVERRGVRRGVTSVEVRFCEVGHPKRARISPRARGNGRGRRGNRRRAPACNGERCRGDCAAVLTRPGGDFGRVDGWRVRAVRVDAVASINNIPVLIVVSYRPHIFLQNVRARKMRTGWTAQEQSRHGQDVSLLQALTSHFEWRFLAPAGFVSEAATIYK